MQTQGVGGCVWEVRVDAEIVLDRAVAVNVGQVGGGAGRVVDGDVVQDKGGEGGVQEDEQSRTRFRRAASAVEDGHGTVRAARSWTERIAADKSQASALQSYTVESGNVR